MTLFTRSPLNPILVPTERWWEARGVLNPAAAVVDGRVALIYRAVGADGISRFGLAWTEDGERITERSELPWYEAALDDPEGRLGVEDPRITPLDGVYFLSYCKASVEPAGTPRLSWETAPFHIRSGIGVTEKFSGMKEYGAVMPDRNTKDAVFFPERIGGHYTVLVREYPSIQLTTSEDLLKWTVPDRALLEPIPGTWEAERVGAGPPPIRTPWGWLLLYHGNEYLHLPENHRMYSMGLAVLDADDPSEVLYRHPDPIFRPEAPYEIAGPVGNVVFGTGLVERGDTFYLYYGAADGVIGVATTPKETLYELLRAALGGGAVR